MTGECVFLAYDARCRVHLEAPDRAAADALTARCRALALEVEATLSMYDPASELARLCAGYRPGAEYPISPMLADFLSLNLTFCERTGGAFDPTVGPLVKLWDFLADTPCVPARKELDAALARVGYRHVHLDVSRRRVRIDVPGVVLDPGASGKGYALGLAVDMLRRYGVQNAVLDFGGNLFLLGGRRVEDGGERPWRVALLDPEHTGAAIGTVHMRNMGVATSSWYGHSFRRNGKLYHHLLDPATGTPRPLTLQSVSILSSNAAYTDILSTAFFMLGAKRGAALVQALAEASGEFIGYVAVTDAREILHSANVDFHAG